jgi:hypothetical protein
MLSVDYVYLLGLISVTVVSAATVREYGGFGYSKTCVIAA